MMANVVVPVAGQSVKNGEQVCADSDHLTYSFQLSYATLQVMIAADREGLSNNAFNSPSKCRTDSETPTMSREV